MKITTRIIITIFLLGSTSFVFNGCSDKSEAKTQKVVIALPTVKCDNCKKTIEATLHTVPGVQSSVVTVKGNKSVEVLYTTGQTDENKIRTAISKAGYTADNVVRDSAAYEDLDNCCK